jgi:hypothetical protein
MPGNARGRSPADPPEDRAGPPQTTAEVPHQHMTERLAGSSRERLAERLSAACYGTVLVLAALPLINADDVSSGLGWELITGVGVTTWVAHMYAEVVGDHLRRGSSLDRAEISRAMVDGLPILLAAVLPGFMLFLGRIDVLEPRLALWSAVAAAVLQLVGVGAFVGASMSPRRPNVWWYALGTALVGIAVVSLKVALGH